jgi:4-amino-4-deoxy-L-arabinose transferase-like glycosyltransferase
MNRRRSRISIVRPPVLEQTRRTWKLAPVIAALVLAGVPFLLGKYIELNSPDPFDSPSYVYSAKHILDGARFGIEEQPSAQPATLLVNIVGVKLFGFNETGPKLIQTLLQAGALVLMYYTVRRLFGSLGAVVSVTVASYYLSAPVISKFGNVKEQHMIAFMVFAACCFILYRLDGKRWMAVLAGAAAINAPYFKMTGSSVVVAMLVFLVMGAILKHDSWRKLLTDVALLAIGALIGIVPIVLFLLWQGQLAYLFTTTPFRAASFVAAPTMLVIVAGLLGRLCIRHRIWRRLAEVRLWIPIAGAAVMTGMLGYFLIRFAKTGDAVSYLEEIPFIKVFLDLNDMVNSVVWKFRTLAGGYVGGSRRAAGLSVMSPVILRYYMVLILPITLASVAIVARLAKRLIELRTKAKPDGPDRYVLLPAVWWILDMAFVWISPRSYEQYYLPLNASAAMLGGYLSWLYSQRLLHSAKKAPWIAGGLVAGLCMIIMSWQIFFGLTTSPFSGTKYPQPSRGYVQRLAEASAHRKGLQLGPWEAAGDHIRLNSTDNDTIYVWGWVPGVYVRAQRLCPAPRAFESEMHVKSPLVLARDVNKLLEHFAKAPPKFIVDTHKQHYPWGKTLPLELWPILPQGFMGAKGTQFLPNDDKAIAQYDQVYYRVLLERSGPDEVERYKAMAPFRKYVMDNYKVAATFGQPPQLTVLFERKTAGAGS